MFKFKCYPDGGEEFEVVARDRAIVAWENAPGQPKSQPRRSVGELTKSFRMTDMSELAWFAASRARLTELDLPGWREQVDVELLPYDEDDHEAGPTTVAP